MSTDAGTELFTSANNGDPVCVPPPPLPGHLLVAAARTATELCPPNAPPPGAISAADAILEVARAMVPGLEIALPEPPPVAERIAMMTGMYFGPERRELSVSFMESTPANLAARIVSHANAWKCGVTFRLTNGQGDVRISRGGGGYWSYLGVSILHIPTGENTMNLEGFTMETPEAEFRRVIRHEFGHTLGCPHEHARSTIVARIDPDKAIPYFRRFQGWSPAEIRAQVLTPLDERTLIGTPPDETSIMTYQLPGSITFDGKPIGGGIDINPTDAAFMLGRYPVAVVPTPTPTPGPTPTPTPSPTPTPTPAPASAEIKSPLRGNVVIVAGKPFLISGTIILTPR